jgi:NADH-quinone oxidoreductase subunit M
MIGHALISSASFSSVGVLHERYKTRILLYFGGLAYVMPILSLLIFIFMLANIGCPGTLNFVGDS